MMLETKGLTKRFGGLTVIDNLDVHLNEGEILGFIGPNGAGKSTFFNLITGVLPPSSGKILYNGTDITRARPHQVAAMGIGRTFQLNPLFGDFTVLENVVAAHQLHPCSSLWDAYFNTKTFCKNESAILKSSDDILAMLGLAGVRNEYAKNLSHGHQKLLGVARALAIKPKLLLLDEPLGGMNPEEIHFSIKAIRKMRDEGITILIVEHNMQILRLCDRMVVISFGVKICEGPPEDVSCNKDVISTYLGGVSYE